MRKRQWMILAAALVSIGFWPRESGAIGGH